MWAPTSTPSTSPRRRAGDLAAGDPCPRVSAPRARYHHLEQPRRLRGGGAGRQPGVAQPLLEASPPTYGMAKSGGFERVESLERSRTARASQPVLGRVSFDYGWAAPAALPDLQTAKALTDKARFLAAEPGTGRGQGGPALRRQSRHLHPLRHGRLRAGRADPRAGRDPHRPRPGAAGRPGRSALTARRADRAVDRPRPHPARDRAASGGAEPTRVLQVPVAVAVTRGSDGSLESAGAACPEQRLTTGAPFDYLVGNRAVLSYSHLTGKGSRAAGARRSISSRRWRRESPWTTDRGAPWR